MLVELDDKLYYRWNVSWVGVFISEERGAWGELKLICVQSSQRGRPQPMAILKDAVNTKSHSIAGPRHHSPSSAAVSSPIAELCNCVDHLNVEKILTADNIVY